MSGIVLSLCDRTGNMVQPWIEAGYEAITVDLQDSPTASKARHHFVADVTRWRYPLRFGRPIIVFAFPPCTNLAVSGARWFQVKGLSALIYGLSIVDACRDICEESGAPYMIENPVSTLSTYWRKPDHTFHPWEYTSFELGDNYTKKTCLWTSNGFVMPPRRQQQTRNPTTASTMHRRATSARTFAAPPRWDLRERSFGQMQSAALHYAPSPQPGILEGR